MEHMYTSPLDWSRGALRLLDQTRLPEEEVWLSLSDHRRVAEAIRSMRLRGAPAIGVRPPYAESLRKLTQRVEVNA